MAQDGCVCYASGENTMSTMGFYLAYWFVLLGVLLFAIGCISSRLVSVLILGSCHTHILLIILR